MCYSDLCISYITVKPYQNPLSCLFVKLKQIYILINSLIYNISRIAYHTFDILNFTTLCLCVTDGLENGDL